MERIGAVVDTHQFVSKLMSNSPILSNNHELRSIVVKKGRIQRNKGILRYLLKFDQIRQRIEVRN